MLDSPKWQKEASKVSRPTSVASGWDSPSSQAATLGFAISSIPFEVPGHIQELLTELEDLGDTGFDNVISQSEGQCADSVVGVFAAVSTSACSSSRPAPVKSADSAAGGGSANVSVHGSGVGDLNQPLSPKSAERQRNGKQVAVAVLEGLLPTVTTPPVSPVVEYIPQHYQSDLLMQRAVFIVPAAQVRWVSTRTHQCPAAIRRELASKMSNGHNKDRDNAMARAHLSNLVVPLGRPWLAEEKEQQLMAHAAHAQQLLRVSQHLSDFNQGWNSATDRALRVDTLCERPGSVVSATALLRFADEEVRDVCMGDESPRCHGTTEPCLPEMPPSPAVPHRPRTSTGDAHAIAAGNLTSRPQTPTSRPGSICKSNGRPKARTSILSARQDSSGFDRRSDGFLTDSDEESELGADATWVAGLRRKSALRASITLELDDLDEEDRPLSPARQAPVTPSVASQHRRRALELKQEAKRAREEVEKWSAIAPTTSELTSGLTRAPAVQDITRDRQAVASPFPRPASQASQASSGPCPPSSPPPSGFAVVGKRPQSRLSHLGAPPPTGAEEYQNTGGNCDWRADLEATRANAAKQMCRRVSDFDPDNDVDRRGSSGSSGGGGDEHMAYESPLGRRVGSVLVAADHAEQDRFRLMRALTDTLADQPR